MGPRWPLGHDGARSSRQTLSQRLQAPGRPARQVGPGPRSGALSPWLLPAVGTPRNGPAWLRRRFRLPPAPRPELLFPARQAPPRDLVFLPAGCARTCRTRCRASTKPSAFIPTGALCPCTNSAITAPRRRRPRSRRRRLAPRSGLPLYLGTRSRKRKVALLPAEGKPGHSQISARGAASAGAGSGHVTFDRSEVGAGGQRRGGFRSPGSRRSPGSGRDPSLPGRDVVQDRRWRLDRSLRLGCGPEVSSVGRLESQRD